MEPAAQSVALGNRPTILVIDDQDDVRGMVMGMHAKWRRSNGGCRGRCRSRVDALSAAAGCAGSHRRHEHVRDGW